MRLIPQVSLFALLAAVAFGAMKHAPAIAGQANKPLPYHAREVMRELDKTFRSIDSAYSFIDEYKKDPHTTPDRYKQKLDLIEEAIKGLQPLLDEAKAEAAKQGVTDHPDFQAAQARIDAAPGKLAAAKAAITNLQAENAAAAGKVKADADALVKEYERLRTEVFDPLPSFVRVETGAKLEDVQAHVRVLLKLSEETPRLQELLDTFAKRYGSTEAEVRESMEKGGYDPAFQPARALLEIRAGLEKAAQARTTLAEALVAYVDETLSPASLSKLHEFFVASAIHGDQRALLDAARQLAPDNAKVTAALAGLEQKTKGAEAALAARIAAHTWPPKVAGAPADAQKLAATALTYFKQDIGWGRRDQNPEAKDKEPRRPLAVVVTGAWSVQERNLLGQPTMYGLPVALAVQLDSEKPRGLARVFLLTLRTAERAGVKPAPPFDSVTVGNSYYVLASKVAAGR